MKRLLFIVGTRPEAIKMAPLILQATAHKEAKVCVLSTGQHPELVAEILGFFGIQCDIRLPSITDVQLLSEKSAKLIAAIGEHLKDTDYDVVIVQGDTISTFCAGLAAFYSGIPVAHVEAGLRTDSPFNPFPEEANRRMLSCISTTHFAPTHTAMDHLRKQGITERLFMVGNTGIDALKLGITRLKENTEYAGYADLYPFYSAESRHILVTMHRRENWEDGIVESVCLALNTLATTHGVHSVVCTNANPELSRRLHANLSPNNGIHILPPLSYPEFIWHMSQSDLILTDSGGIQEEAPSIGKHVCVLRNKTERPEGVLAGFSTLVGTQTESIVQGVLNRLNAAIPKIENPYGDGHASERILLHLLGDTAH
jgi:UDP-N-acetylglucosamine 2-epimerase (non-hydrolysing)